MNRMIKIGGSSILAASALAATLALTVPGTASAGATHKAATSRPAAVALAHRSTATSKTSRHVSSRPAAASATATTRHATSRPATSVASPKAPGNYPLPKTPTWFRAGSAGSVMVAKGNSGTIKVVKVSAAKGYKAVVDSSSGSSVDVYFRHGNHTLKFEAEVNDSGGLTVRVTLVGTTR
ncbi:MAG TPA: hypothetical protein VKA05_07095 [Acidimicrobiales bacterium]|nr:hypothetical protein [Acidimicrobiales bacterium]